MAANLDLFPSERGDEPLPGPERHYRLAMQASRRMRRVRSKRRTGHLICEHLRRMLESG